MTAHARQLIARRRADAEMLRRYGHKATANALDGYSKDLDKALRADARDAFVGPEYDIKEASARSGYSIAQLSRMVQMGEIENQNPGGIARVRAHELPCRPGRLPYVMGWLDPHDEVTAEQDRGEARAAILDDADGVPTAELGAESGTKEDSDSPFTKREYEAFRRGRRSA
jgi:hypothetical protein